MGLTKKLAISTALPNPSPTLDNDVKPNSTSSSFLKRKPVKSVRSSGSPNPLSIFTEDVIKTSTTFTPPHIEVSDSSIVDLPQQQQQLLQPSSNQPPSQSSKVKGVASSIDERLSKAAPVSVQQSQDELFSKLEQLAAAKNNVKSSETQRGMGIVMAGTGGGNDSHRILSSAKSHGSSSSSVDPKPREPRRRINSAQFKTPSVVEMAELAQVVVANASPPKVQNKLRKRASTLSLTATTFMPPGSQNNSVAGITSHGTGGVIDNHRYSARQDFRQLYEAALKEAKAWEKKYSSAQNQIHYERERWEEKYGELERMYKVLENSRTEANVDKMNSLLDTVQQLQVANEVFRKQLQDAGIEPDPMPSAQFHSRYLLVGENLDRTFLEENEIMKEKSLLTNQKITHLSSEINNVTIAISQTINYVQLRYLTQMLDAAEHVSSQRRTRAMSNSFLSDMLSRGVKKPGSALIKNTNTIATQTTAVDLQHGMNNGSTTFRPLENTLSRTFSFTNSLMNLTGLSNNGQGPTEIMYRLKGGVSDDRSQLTRQGIPSLVVQDLKGKPTTPDSADLIAATRVNPPAPKFQYASPTTSQLRIFVPDSTNVSTHGLTSCNMSIGSGSRASSILDGFEGHGGDGGSKGGGQLRRSSSEPTVLIS
ncbi:hypothetical protein FBU30_005851 [Linnemannia zychae]|nr:hypothetical protein FBU30_005851 [Linnemannia zychae]